jgi:hypothetical protein
MRAGSPIRAIPGRWVALAAVTALILTAALVPSAAAVNTKRILVNITPHDLAAGAKQTFTVTFTNQANHAQFGSADVTAPRSYTVLSASTPRGTATVSGRTVQLRDLATPPHETLAVTIVAQLACITKTSTWIVNAKVANDFSSGDFVLGEGSNVRTSGTGNCKLVFLREPADAEAGAAITSGDVDPEAPPVKVAFYDGNGNTINGSSIDVTVSIANNPSGGTLSGTATVAAVDGVAVFSDLSIDNEGLGYTLRASAPGFTGVTSDSFDIVGGGAVCTGSSCSATTSDESTTINVTTHGDGVVEVSLAVENLDCPGYTEVTSVITFSSTTSARKRITVVIGPPLARPKSEGRFQVCYSSTTPFKDKFGEMVTTGLLASCRAARPNPPCIVSTDYGGGMVTVEFLAPAGDPKGRL